MPLDPQCQAFLDKLARSQAPPMHTLPPEEARALVVPLLTPKERMARIENRWVPGPGGDIPVRVYHPLMEREAAGSTVDRSSALPMLLFFHGGGWVLGSIASHDALCRRLCNESRCIVVSVEYRLAPEHKYPAAVDDCWASTRWVAEHAAALGGDPARIAVAGDSAGGNLAAVVARRARDCGGPKLVFQVLIYPITDYMPEFESYATNGAGYFLTIETVEWFWRNYLNDPSEGRQPDAAPLRVDDLSGLPSALVLVAEYDPLLDEGLAYADRLERMGVSVERIVCDGMIHGFVRRLDAYDRAGKVVKDLARSLRATLGVS